MVQSKTVILTGPTASGKSSLVIELALELQKKSVQLEVINADSVCFYREFNIGSAKPDLTERKEIPHHLIDVANPDEHYHAGKFLEDCSAKLDEIHQRGHRAIIVGGSGFYLKALRMGLWEAPATDETYRASLAAIQTSDLFEKLESLDPLHAKKIGSSDRYRIIRALEIIEKGSGEIPSELEARMPDEPDSRFELWVIDREKSELEKRIRERIESMLSQGWVQEVKLLLEKYPASRTLQAVGYRQIVDDLKGIYPSGRLKKTGSEGLIDEIALSHRQLAKAQRTWIKSLNPNETFMLDQDLPLLKEKLMNFYQK